MKDLHLLPELTAIASTAQHIAFDFLIPNKLLRDPFQMNAATVATAPRGNKFIQSVAFAIGSDVWIVAFREEFLGALVQILGSTTRKVHHALTLGMLSEQDKVKTIWWMENHLGVTFRD